MTLAGKCQSNPAPVQARFPGRACVRTGLYDTLGLMNDRLLTLVGAWGMAIAAACHAQVKVAYEHHPEGTGFVFEFVPRPAQNDAAAQAEWGLVDGERDGNGGALTVLQDGRVPVDEDQPGANFFFRAGADGGRLRVDLGRAVAVKQVNTYSWHTGTRAPQVYTLYASDGLAAGFSPAPGRGTDPATCGWKRVAQVDTRPKEGEWGGPHGVSVAEVGTGVLGQYRYLLFDLRRTEDRDAFGNTFYSEIDVVDASGPAPVPVSAGPDAPIVRSFEVEGGKYRFTIDATAAPDLIEWAESTLQPVVREWYPKLVALLPGEGFEPATRLTLRFRDDMGGTPASAGGGRVNLNADWFRRELNREALGAVVHELVHVVQDYGRARRTNRAATRTPGWLVEGMADYIRWFRYEPETKGAEITARNLDRARYDSSYRITGNFLDWVTRCYDREIVRKLNAAAREGKYSEELWKEWTGKTVQELGEEWRKANEERVTDR